MRKCEGLIGIGRRNFLRGGGVAAAGGIAAAVVSADKAQAAPTLARVAYTAAKVGNVADLKIDLPVDISYPDNASPGVLIKLGKPVERGVGPDRDIVAFSTLCPHKGFLLRYIVADQTLNCPGHYSRFDCEKGGQQVWGHATQNLPQFSLRVDSNGDIYAEAVDELIYGRLSNVLSP